MAPVKGFPPHHPRVKTYSAATGFAYQYQFVLHESSTAGEVYRFSTTHDRRSPFDVTVLLTPETIQAAETVAHRSFSPTEMYAFAKLALFSAFDTAESPAQIPAPINPSPAEVQEIRALLDL